MFSQFEVERNPCPSFVFLPYFWSSFSLGLSLSLSFLEYLLKSLYLILLSVLFFSFLGFILLLFCSLLFPQVHFWHSLLRFSVPSFFPFFLLLSFIIFPVIKCSGSSWEKLFEVSSSLCLCLPASGFLLLFFSSFFLSLFPSSFLFFSSFMLINLLQPDDTFFFLVLRMLFSSPEFFLWKRNTWTWFLPSSLAFSLFHFSPTLFSSSGSPPLLSPSLSLNFSSCLLFPVTVSPPCLIHDDDE